MMTTLKISRGDNGYKLGWFEEQDDGSDTWRESYIQDDEQDELKSGIELLWRVIDYFNLSGSKHDKQRIRVEREKQ